MDNLRIHGGIPLRGNVQVSGSKNAALPILISSLLTEDTCQYSRVPELQDIKTTEKLLTQLGAKCSSDFKSNQFEVCTADVNQLEAPYDLVRTMRASVVVLGPMLARFGQAKVSLPGGCAIGARPIDLHLMGLERLGASIELEEGYVIAKAKRLTGARIVFNFPSVGATENVLMAATLARGESVLENCAREPEIVDLARALRAMGAKIEGEGTEKILVQGRDRLQGLTYPIMGDRIEAGTYLAAALATGGAVKVEGIEPTDLDSVLVKFEECGGQVSRGPDWIEVKAPAGIRGTDLVTAPFPGFPTDMQAQLMALFCVASGASLITETIFENRFMHVPELQRLGADITIRGNSAMVRGVAELHGAPVMATDLRASASLIIAGLAAKGETRINRIYHLDRGYEHLELKLQKLGAVVSRYNEAGEKVR